jgi:hypothetical protein
MTTDDAAHGERIIDSGKYWPPTPVGGNGHVRDDDVPPPNEPSDVDDHHAGEYNSNGHRSELSNALDSSGPPDDSGGPETHDPPALAKLLLTRSALRELPAPNRSSRTRSTRAPPLCCTETAAL